LRELPFVEAPGVRVDLHRHLRCGHPEVIFCQRKTPAQIRGIAERLLRSGQRLLATRATPEAFEAIRCVDRRARFHEEARAVTVRNGDRRGGRRGILIVTAGTSDRPVAEEARVTAEWMGHRAEMIFDAGVAGIHRLLADTRRLQRARVLVVAAGMEGALPGVVGGLVARPVIAVPTSVGYGANFGGLSALLTMINSCAAGVSVVNIDNGFGAGYLAALINAGR
jgi:NCAIR mutase (PurE)-related protein